MSWWVILGVLGLFAPRVAALWIDESPMNLCEILGLQPKGVATLSFSSRKRPAYAGMTVLGTMPCHCGLDPQSRGAALGGRHTGFKAVSTGRQGDTGEQANTTYRIPSPLMGEG